MELKCVPQVYDWGKKGEASFVARLLAASNSSFQVDSKVPYAELWMGTHPNGESVIRSTGETLFDYLKKNPKVLGIAQSLHGGDLPFLFKVLSIQKALSVQVHPNKETAEKLNSLYPELYRDKNHKPELAVALTDFECLVGFRPMEEIVHFLDIVPELSKLFSRDILDKFSGQGERPLALLFEALMNSPEQKVKENLDTLVNRLSDSVKKVKDECLYNLVKKLTTEFPNDVGCFTIYFLNYIKLKPGEAVFLAAGLPHAYLSGDIMEVMACSDNVVRAGLTPKHRDIQTLCNILDHTSYTPASLFCKSTKTDGIASIYHTPVKDFGLTMIDIPPLETYSFPQQSSCSIVIVVEGKGDSSQMKVEAGNVVFFPAEASIEIINPNSEPIKIFQAYSKI